MLYYFGWWELFLIGLRFSPTLLKFAFGFMDNYEAKQKLFIMCFKGTDLEVFQKKCNDFATKILPKIIRPKAQQKLDWHLSNQDEIVIVSASISNYLIPFFAPKKFKVLSTELQLIDNTISGKFIGNNCYGLEKKKRILNQFNLTEYNHIYAYGNSRGDKEMLELASHPYLGNFN